MTKRTPQQKPKSQPKTVPTLTELAAFCGCSITTIRIWKSTHGFPVEEDGTYSPFRAGRWHAAREMMANPIQPEELDEDGDEIPSEVSSPALERLRE